MYICICNGITDRDIREQVADGACNVRDLECALGVGAGCGRCREAAAEVLGEALAVCDSPARRASATLRRDPFAPQAA